MTARPLRSRSGLAGVLAAMLPALAAQAAEERFYDREKFTIVYRQTGKVDAGEFTEHVRDWGRTRVEISRTTTTVMGMTQRKHQRVVFEGAKLTTVDLASGAVTTTRNPMYDQVVASLRGRSGVEFGRQMMVSMGGKPTGEKGSFAGHDCDYWTVARLGARVCVTPWGATLHLASTFAGLDTDRRAVEVRVGDPGPPAAYAYDASKAVRQPSLEDLMKRARPGG